MQLKLYLYFVYCFSYFQLLFLMLFQFIFAKTTDYSMIICYQIIYLFVKYYNILLINASNKIEIFYMVFTTFLSNNIQVIYIKYTTKKGIINKYFTTFIVKYFIDTSH